MDPVVHGVAEHEPRTLELLQHLALQHRIDVCQEHLGEGAQAVVKLGAELLEDVQLGAQGLARVHVRAVDPFPPEGLPRAHFDAREIQIGVLEREARFGGKVAPDDRDDRDREEMPGGEREVRRGSPQHVLHAPGRGLDRVQAQRAHDRDRHAYIDSGALTPRRSSPRRNTRPVARVRRSLAAVTAASGPTTRWT